MQIGLFIIMCVCIHMCTAVRMHTHIQGMWCMCVCMLEFKKYP